MFFLMVVPVLFDPPGGQNFDRTFALTFVYLLMVRRVELQVGMYRVVCMFVRSRWGNRRCCLVHIDIAPIMSCSLLQVVVSG